jgi:hypothetical protein
MPGIGIMANKSIVPNGLKNIEVNNTADIAPDAPTEL